MFDHVTIRVSDRAASERFYEMVLGTLGVEKTYSGEDLPEWDDFSLTQADREHPVTRRVHIGFGAPSREHVRAFWQAGVDAGHRSDGEPGRPEYGSDYYGGFLLGLDGNSAEAVHHSSLRDGGSIDHLWIRVADLAAARSFYLVVAPFAGFELHGDHENPRRARFAGASGSFSVVEGTPTEHLHIAFPGGSNEQVDDFHRTVTGAGHRDNGAPGERPAYHPGYYGGFVLDPGGNNVEVVHHNRSQS
jgi:catechol 2,3-dioxygenase-like lactoylglutathione lyase family enzyme